MGLKSFLGKVGRGITRAGRWFKEKALPAVGRIAKPILSTIGTLPGKIGPIGRLGGIISNVLHDTISKIPNKDVRDKLDDTVARGNEKFQKMVGKGEEYAKAGRDMVDTAKRGWNEQIKPAIPSPSINNQIAKFMLPNAQ